MRTMMGDGSGLFCEQYSANTLRLPAIGEGTQMSVTTAKSTFPITRVSNLENTRAGGIV